ncbi:hypothetical protein CsSME_00040108 [Camellia sinensis var. sinensis]
MLGYQVVAGVIEQRILEPLVHQHKLILSALCFAVRTGNTFLGGWIMLVGQAFKSLKNQNSRLGVHSVAAYQVFRTECLVCCISRHHRKAGHWNLIESL